MKNDIILAQIDLDLLIKNYQPVKKYSPIPVFPGIKEELTITVNNEIHIGDLVREIYQIDPLIKQVDLLTSYKNNYTFSIYYLNPSKNISDQIVKIVRDRIQLELEKNYKLSIKKKQ